MEINKKYPLIDLIQTKIPCFWVYNNYAYVYKSYLESYKLNNKWEVMGDYQKKPELDNLLEVWKNDNIYYIQNDNFNWIDEVYFEKGLPIKNWDYSEYVINCFSARYDLGESEMPFDNDKIYNIKIFHKFENLELYPDSEQLDLLVKEYLKNIITQWTNKNTFDMGGMSGIDILPNRLYAFFDYHFEEYQGDMHDFVNHSIELVKGLWNVENVKNANRQKCFDFWVEDKIVKNNLDRSKLKLELNTIPKIIKNQDLKVFDNMKFAFDNQLYALIELVEVKEIPFWTYNNLAYKFKKIENKMPKIDIGRFTVDTGNGWFKFNIIQDALFKMRTSSVPVPNVENQEIFNRFAIKCFSANYQIRYKNEFVEESTGEGWIENFEIFDFEKYDLYPDPKELEYCVQFYLSNYSLTIEETINSFLDFHFNNYKGDKKEFIKNCIKVRKPLWKEHSLDNIRKRKTFTAWLDKVCKEYDLKIEELEQSMTSKITDEEERDELSGYAELLQIRELNSHSTENYFDRDLGFLPSKLYLALDNQLKGSSNTYETISKLNKRINKYWGESFEDIKKKNVFNEWLNNVISEHNLDHSKLGLEPIATPEPPQEQDNNDVQNTAKPTKKEILLYYEYTEWSKTFKIKTQMFLEISRLFNFSPKSLKTAENDLANKRKIYLSDSNNVTRLTELLEGNENALKRLNEDLEQHKIV